MINIIKECRDAVASGVPNCRVITIMLNDALKELEGEKESPWISVEDALPPTDVEVIALTDICRICFAHIVDKTIAKNYNGWNIPHVVFWMPWKPSGKMIEFFG